MLQIQNKHDSTFGKRADCTIVCAFRAAQSNSLNASCATGARVRKVDYDLPTYLQIVLVRGTPELWRRSRTPFPWARWPQQTHRLDVSRDPRLPELRLRGIHGSRRTEEDARESAGTASTKRKRRRCLIRFAYRLESKDSWVRNCCREKKKGSRKTRLPAASRELFAHLERESRRQTNRAGSLVLIRLAIPGTQG